MALNLYLFFCKFLKNMLWLYLWLFLNNITSIILNFLFLRLRKIFLSNTFEVDL